MDTDSFFKYTEQFPRRLNQVTFKNWQNMVIVYGGVEVELSGNVLTNEAKFAAMATACSSHAKIVVAEYGRIMPDEITEDNILCVVQPDDKNPTSKNNNIVYTYRSSQDKRCSAIKMLKQLTNTETHSETSRYANSTILYTSLLQYFYIYKQYSLTLTYSS